MTTPSPPPSWQDVQQCWDNKPTEACDNTVKAFCDTSPLPSPPASIPWGWDARKVCGCYKPSPDPKTAADYPEIDPMCISLSCLDGHAYYPSKRPACPSVATRLIDTTNPNATHMENVKITQQVGSGTVTVAGGASSTPIPPVLPNNCSGRGPCLWIIIGCGIVTVAGAVLIGVVMARRHKK